MRKRSGHTRDVDRPPRSRGALVFVYGTLKRGSSYHDRYLGGCGRFLGRARIFGELWDTGWGYPALVPGVGWVYGELYGGLGADDLARCPACVRILPGTAVA